MAGFKEYRRNTRSMSDVGPNGTPVVEFPVSIGQIDRSEIKYTEDGTAATKTQMEDNILHYQFLFGGDTFATYKPENVLMLNDFYGHPFEDGYLDHHFTESWRQNVNEAEATSFLPGLFVDPALRIVLNSSAASPEMEHWMQSEGIGEKGRQSANIAPASTLAKLQEFGFPGLIKHAEHNIRIYASGETENDWDFERGSDVIRGWHFKGSTITAIRMLVDGQERANFKDKRALDRLLEAAGFVPQDDIWSFVPEVLAGSSRAHFRRNHGNAPNEVQFKIKTSDTTDVDCLVEQYEMPPIRANAGG